MKKLLNKISNREWLTVTLGAVFILIKQIFDIEIANETLDTVVNIVGIIFTIISAITNPNTKGLGD